MFQIYHNLTTQMIKIF